MLVPTTRLFQAGEQLTGSMLNQTVTSLGNFMLGKPIAAVYQSTGGQAIGTTWTAITMQTEIVDRDGGHSTSTNTSRYTGATPGYYRVSGTLAWTSATAPTNIAASIGKNGVAGTAVIINTYSRYVSPTASAPLSGTVVTGTGLVYLNGTTDYVELWGIVTGGTTVTTNNSSPWYSSLTVEWVSL